MREVSIRTSKKNRRCSMCGKSIKKGNEYIRLTLGDLYVRRFKYYAICFDCWANIKLKLKNTKGKVENTSNS